MTVGTKSEDAILAKEFMVIVTDVKCGVQSTRGEGCGTARVARE